MPSPEPIDAAPAESAPAGPVRYRCRHTTRYDYGEEVPVSHHVVHLTPRSHPRQRCRRATLTVAPVPAVRADHTDYFGNPVTYVAVQEPHRQFVVTAETEVEVQPPPAFDPAQTSPWERLRDAVRSGNPVPGDGGETLQYAFDSVLVPTGRDLAAFAAPSFAAGAPVAVGAIALMRRIHEEFTFDPAATTVATPIAEVMASRRGVCQDFAHLLIGALRSLGLPARYVSGYLRTLPPPGRPRLIGADVSHAWGAVWCGGDLWLDLCPTNGRTADHDFITVAWGRDYTDVSPVRGVIHGSTGHGLMVEVDVEPLDD